MGTVVKRRGRGGRVRYYGKLKDLTGVWTTRALTGAETVAQARTMLAEAERRVRLGEDPFPGPVAAVPLAGVLLTTWATGLRNAAADADRWKVEKHLQPRWKNVPIDRIDARAVMAWLDDLATGALGPQSRLHLFGTLSRFLGWCVERGHLQANACRMVPRGRRPKVRISRERPWLRDEDLDRAMTALEKPLDLMLWIGNRSGLRPGEVAGLRMSDMDGLSSGVIRVRYSYARPLKEDRHDEGKVKWAPAATNAEEVLGSWLSARRAAGAKGEDLVFPYTRPPLSIRRTAKWLKWGGYHRAYIQRKWREMQKATGLMVSLNEATRHSFVTRNLEAGASLEEVSEAIGHSSPVITHKHYSHVIRKRYSDVLRRPVVTPQPSTARTAETSGDAQPAGEGSSDPDDSARATPPDEEPPGSSGGGPPPV